MGAQDLYNLDKSSLSTNDKLLNQLKQVQNAKLFSKSERWMIIACSKN